MYKLLEIGIITYNLDNNDVPLELSLIAFVITIFSAIRLAIFNNDTRQTSSFIGVPTPAVAIFICSIPLVLQNNNQYLIFLNPIFLIVTSIIFSILLVSELPLFALKFKTFGWKGNRTKYIFLGLSLLLLIFLEFVGIPLIILLYIIMSLITHLYMKRKKV
jgi:CDP-diacylglycerol--serine O-phosphatidyltransferase